jgi:hypothetical protein
MENLEESTGREKVIHSFRDDLSTTVVDCSIGWLAAHFHRDYPSGMLLICSIDKLAS